MASALKKKKRAEVSFSNLNKVFFPKTGFTKGEMIKYYVDIAPHLIPHLKNRPITLVRFPDGLSGERFYEKNAPAFAPEWLKTFLVPRRHREGHIRYILINDAASLAWCANIAGLELHPFLHRVPKVDCPTHVAFDFDPGEGADLITCTRVAFYVKAILDELGLEGFPKVSGSKGLQLYVPLNTPVTYAATSAFAKAVAELLEQQHPDLVISTMDKQQRRNKVLIDWSQNSASKTTVAVYSMRGKRERPYVSMPVTWKELTRLLRDKKKAAFDFSPSEAVKRIKRRGDLFAPVLTLKQKLPKAFKSTSPTVRSSAALKRYEAKRDFSKTREPKPSSLSSSSRKKKGSARAARFVIQKHDATRLHYDFRLEMDETLKSWAVPKGLSPDPGTKRAAFEVEDHPLDYLKFEGTIPKGQYGGGTVMVWDIGTYELLGGSHASGDLKLKLHGKKIKGEWHLFRIRSEDGKPVWLIMKSGSRAKALTARQDDMSVLTRRSMARIAKDNDAQWESRAV
ncbi:MAG TPA: non-homologous end-joining DNA ligase [Opitutaceae bacterium]|nr:non-homologous end-joining DNA ligase [Opitutaceae bacterium]